MNALSLNPNVYLTVHVVVNAVTRVGRGAGRFVATLLGLRGRVSHNRHVRGGRRSTWLELFAHYVIAVFIWSHSYGRDDSALGRRFRTVIALLALVTTGLTLGG